MRAFDPGPLGVPVPSPDPRLVRTCRTPRGLSALAPGARQQHAQDREAARVRFSHDQWAAQQAESERLRRLSAERRRYQQWAVGGAGTPRRAQPGSRRLGARSAQGVPEAIPDYFIALLGIRRTLAVDFPSEAEVGWDAAEQLLVVNWELPGMELVPTAEPDPVREVGRPRIEIKRPAGERREIYRRVLAQCALRVLWELFRAPLPSPDGLPLVRCVAFNGHVVRPDPATGRDGDGYLISLLCDRTAFEQIDLNQVEPVKCVEGLGGRLSPRPDKLVEVRPIRLPSAGMGEEVNLLRINPGEFEDLVADLFRAMGLQTETTARSRDGGVDVIATDPDPIRGGRMVIQVKRYDSTIPPAVIRDLYGTVVHEGAIKGILVTTSGFGPSSYSFAEGKPLTLINGTELVSLLARHGLSGRIHRP